MQKMSINFSRSRYEQCVSDIAYTSLYYRYNMQKLHLTLDA